MSKESPSSLGRLLQIRRVINKYNLIELFDGLSLSRKARWFTRLAFRSHTSHQEKLRGERIRLALEELGPVFVKLGQALSTRPDLLPLDIAQELTKLQDQVPAFSGEQALSIIRDAYGESFDDIFESVDETPMASASVAQVHAATLKTGLSIEGQDDEKRPEVIIKVIRPGIEQVIDSDLKVMRTFTGLLQKHWSRGKQFRPLDVIQEYENTIRDELDLRIEAANGGRMGANFEDSDLIYVPRIYWDYTQKNVLVMERIYGTSIREIDTLKEKGYDLEQLANDGVNTFFKQAFEDNFFHADMHAGNIFVCNKGKWIAIDFGIMGTLDEQDKQYLGEMLLGFFNRDYKTIAQAHLRAGWIPPNTRVAEFELAVRVVCEPIFAKPISEISFGNVLMQLFQTVRRFEMPVQPQLVLLYKTLLNIEGLGRQLYPDLNLWDTAKPFLEQWMKKQLSPAAILEDMKRDWPQWRSLLPQLPELIKQRLEQSEQKPTIIEPKKSIALSIGLVASAFGFCLAILGQNQLIDNVMLLDSAPWIGVFGLVLIYLKVR